MMNWIGLIIGGTLGWFLSHSVLGAFLGAVLGESLSVGVSRSGWSGRDAAQVQAAFFTATFSVMGHIAKADGHVSEHEIEAARAVMAQMNLDPERQRAAMELFNRGKQPDFILDPVLRELRRECRGRRDLLLMFLQIQLHAALADGVLHPAEQAIFIRLCGSLGISPLELRQYEAFIRAQQSFRGGRAAPSAPDRLAESYRTLGVTPQASDAEVKKAYRRLMARHHPDKLVAKGLPEDMIRLAQEKVQHINVAYDAIKSSRGIN
jgi:DnaJ like chaperone protein